MVFVILEKIICCLSIISVFYFTYIPLLYVVNWFEFDKIIIFSYIIFVIFVFYLFVYGSKIFSKKIIVKHKYAIPIFLYFIFSIYVIFSLVFIGEKLNDNFTIRTLLFINPIFILLSIPCSKNKKLSITFIFIMSGVYYLFLLYSFLNGKIYFDVYSFGSIFLSLEGNYYQNINLYLGFFIICNLYIFYNKYNYIKFISIFNIILSFSGMLSIGGRSSLLMALFILTLWILFCRKKEYTIKFILKMSVASVFFVLTTVLFFSYIEQIFQNSVTVRRILLLFEGGDSSHRLFLFSNALNLFLTDFKTIFFGGGINSFPVYTGSYNTGQYPHNIILELLSEYGLVGSLFFIAPVIYILSLRKRVLGSLWGNSVESRVVFSFFTFTLGIQMFSGGLRSSWMVIFFIFLLIPAQQSFVTKRNVI